MNQSTVMLLLNVLSTPGTTVTEAQMLGILELSGIVRNPVALRALQFGAELPSASAPATLIGLVTTLKNLLKLHPDITHADYKGLEEYIQKVTTAGADSPLTFGTLLPFLASLPSSPPLATRAEAKHRGG